VTPLSGLKSITRNQLLACVDTSPRPYPGKRKIAGKSFTVAQWDRLQKEEVWRAKGIQETINTFLNSPKCDMVAIMVILAMDSSQAGHQQFLKIGPECTFQVEKLNSQTHIGDVPSRFYYAQYFCASEEYIRKQLVEHGKFLYGPFMIHRGADGSYDAGNEPNTELYTAEGFRTNTYVHKNEFLSQILATIDKIRCSAVPFNDLPAIKE